MRVKQNFKLSKFTTMTMGGAARFFMLAASEKDLTSAVEFAKNRKLPWYVVGEGSNLIVSDKAYKGVIIRNKIEKFERKGRQVRVGAGNNLLKLIFKLDRLDLMGLEKMAGIPGTVGGAIYGSAGAYGQEIKGRLISVRIWDGKKFRNLSKKQCKFGYRESIFKKNKNWVITEAVLQLEKGRARDLLKQSRKIIKLREKKYIPGLKCPGSFFKNLIFSEIKPKIAIPVEKILYGKVPAGYLLEEVGARGMREGSILVANHHGNLIYNPNGGRASDVIKLAGRLKNLVKRKFGIRIEEEVQYLGF